MTHYQPYPHPHEAPELGFDSIPVQRDTENLGSWVVVVLLTLIPLVNIIYLLVLAFGAGTSVAKRNFARASLIWMAVGIALSIVLGILIAVAGLSVFAELANNYLLNAV